MFSILEVLITVMMPAMVAVRAQASNRVKTRSLVAIVLTGLLAGVRCSVHFVVLTVSRQAAQAGQSWLPLFLQFKWPSVAYALDIPGRDIFFPLSMLRMALAQRGSPLGVPAQLLYHSGRGSQYASFACQSLLAGPNVRISMSHTATACDNAAVQSLLSTLKSELVYRTHFRTRADAQQALFDFMEVFSTVNAAIPPPTISVQIHLSRHGIPAPIRSR